MTNVEVKNSFDIGYSVFDVHVEMASIENLRSSRKILAFPFTPDLSSQALPFLLSTQ
jgi:hypothetical protein